MIYKDLNKLAILQINEKRKYLCRDESLEILQKYPSNIIYIVFKEILYGVVTTGDISRAF